MTKSRIFSKVDLGTQVVDFGVLDSKGRKVGAVLSACDVVTVGPEPGEDLWSNYYYSKPAGRYFLASVQSTRDGRAFGPTQLDTWYTSEAERDAAVAKSIKAARSRAVKAHS